MQDSIEAIENQYQVHIEKKEQLYFVYNIAGGLMFIASTFKEIRKGLEAKYNG